MRIVLLVAAAVVLPALAACSSSDHHTGITQADLSKSLQDSGLKDKTLADCAAKIYFDQGISQDALKIMTKPGTNAQTTDLTSLGLSKADAQKAQAATQKIVTDCLK